MGKHVLFVHGAGEGAYKEDDLLVRSLKKELGPDYDIHYPAMPDEDNAPYDLWKQKIEKEIAVHKPVVLVGHSIGGSHLAKILTEIKETTSIIAFFLLDAPFWGSEGWKYQGYMELELTKETAAKFPKNISVFIYHTRDDEVVPFSHLALYATLFPQATNREIDKGGHQLNNDLSQVAKDIRLLTDRQ